MTVLAALLLGLAAACMCISGMFWEMSRDRRKAQMRRQPRIVITVLPKGQ